MNIDNKRQGNITLSCGIILKPGVNENLSESALAQDEDYLNALHEEGDITVVAEGRSAVVHRAKFVPGDTVLDENGDPALDEDGNVLVFDEDGNHVVAE